MQQLLMSKRDLIVLSHALEETLAGGAPPQAVIALFQQGAHVVPEVDTYARLAQTTGTVVMGFVPDDRVTLPPDVHGVRFDAAHPLAQVWALAIVGPGISGALVCDDLGSLIEGVGSLDLERRFRARWTFLRDETVTVTRDLLDQLGDALPEAARAGVAEALAAAEASPVTAEEAAIAETFARMLKALEHADHRLRRSREELVREATRAERDELTGAANRHGMRAAIADLAPDGELTAPMGAMVIDLDDFKEVNDVHGHAKGDEVLVAVAETIRSLIRAHDVLVRVGGDEFVVLLPGAQGDVLEGRVHAVADALTGLEVGDLAVSASVGAGVVRSLPVDLQRIDAEMYAAKKRRNTSRS